MSKYAPGAPCWVDLDSPDVDASVDFYGKLMDWTTTKPSLEAGGYRRFQQGAADIAGVMPQMEPGQPTVWATYVSVVDADQTAAKVAAAGGTTLLPPMDRTDHGRVAVFNDPTEAVFGIWQAKSFPGASLVNAPNSLCWNEIRTRDQSASRRSTPTCSAGRPAHPRLRAGLHDLGARRPDRRRHDGDDRVARGSGSNRAAATGTSSALLPHRHSGHAEAVTA